MTVTRRSTPCVGICSTTYGDLVCRGCKRFAHEIVSWNAFDGDQREAIWSRLEELRIGAIARCLRVLDEKRLMAEAEAARVPQAAQRELLDLAYEALRRWRDRDAPPERLGVEALAGADTAQELIRQIDREFYSRSLAHYEHSFKIAAR
jgi:predicted Fe-S protein YdhL (DUF1289 family)